LDGGRSALSKTLTLTRRDCRWTTTMAVRRPWNLRRWFSPMDTTKGRSCPLDTRPTVRRLDAS